MTSVAEGDRVRIHYTGKFEDGTEFDSSLGREPLEFVAGSEQLIEGVSQAVVGMQSGDKKTITVAPAQGYGERRDDLRLRVQRDQVPKEAVVGAILGLTVGEQQMRAVLVELGDDYAVLDGNHPLAGKTLVFDLEVVEIC